MPSFVKYISSKPTEIFIDENNGSIKIQSSLLFSSYYYDFHIKVIDTQVPSLSSSIPIRIYFGVNRYPPQLIDNLTEPSIEISSLGFIYQMKAYDPDLSLNNHSGTFPPSIEYQIDTSINFEIERYTGRLFLKIFNQSIYNLTIILTDFGQPNRLITRKRIPFHITSKKKLNYRKTSMIISTSFILIGGIILGIIILVTLLLYYCCLCKSSTKKSLTNLSPTTPDSFLIDNEYVRRFCKKKYKTNL